MGNRTLFLINWIVVICSGCIALAACNDGDGDSESDADTDEDSDDGGTPTIELSDENNYSLNVDIVIPGVTTTSGQDIEICWDNAVRDMQCHDLDPAADIDNVALVRFRHLSEAEVQTKMTQNDLQQADIDGYVDFQPVENNCANLSDFSFFGTIIDVAEEYTADGGTYLLSLTTGTTPGKGARMLTFLRPQEDSTNTSVAIGEGCGVVTVTADLTAAPQVEVPRSGAWNIGWTGVTTDGQGNEIQSGRIDGIIIGFFEGTSPTELEGQILDLLINATWLWTSDVSWQPAEFAADWGGENGGFDAFDSEGTWLFGLTCSRCYSPAPLFLTVLEP